MAFPESVKLTIRRKTHFQCCLCKELGVEIHHIVPVSDGGTDSEENAAPLCPTCHERYGANPIKRKFIREMRDFWYELCEERYNLSAERLNGIEKQLQVLENQLKGSNFPLFPIAIFYTLRHTTTADAIERAFNSQPGFKKFQGAEPQEIGSFRQSNVPRYNSIKLNITESHCTLSGTELEAVVAKHGILGETAIKTFVSMKVHFYFMKRDTDANPSLSVKKIFDRKPQGISRIELFDRVMFQDCFATGWEVANPELNAFSVSDLKNARLVIEATFLSHDDVNLREPPVLHNLLVYFGQTTPHVLSLDLDTLSSCSVAESTTSNTRWNFANIGLTTRELVLKFETVLTEKILADALGQVT